MNFVAGGARHVVNGVRAALPVGTLARLMAIEAGAALHFSRRFVNAAEHEVRGRSCRDIIGVPYMRAAGAMACLAPRLPGNTVTRAMNRQDRFALVRVMTTRADRITAGAGGECGGCIGRVGVGREYNFTNGPSDGEREPDDKRMHAAGICVSPGHACSLMQASQLHEVRDGTANAVRMLRSEHPGSAITGRGITTAFCEKLTSNFGDMPGLLCIDAAIELHGLPACTTLSIET